MKGRFTIRVIVAVAIRARAHANATIYSVRRIADAELRRIRPLHCGPDTAARNAVLKGVELVTVVDYSVAVAAEDADTAVARVVDCLRVDPDSVVPRTLRKAALLDTMHVPLMLEMDVAVAAMPIAVVWKQVNDADANCSAALRKNHLVAAEVANAGCSIIMAVQEAATKVARTRPVAALAMPMYPSIPVAAARAAVEKDV